MSRAGWDRLTLVLGIAALLQVLLLLARDQGVLLLPLLGAQEPPGALQGPGLAEGRVQARAAAVGDYVNVEDLARGLLAAEQGVPGVPPLTEAERAEVAPLIAEAERHRQELLATEQRLAGAQQALAEQARRIAAGLTPEQRAWILAERDRISVGGIEAAYWEALLAEIGAGAGDPGGSGRPGGSGAGAP